MLGSLVKDPDTAWPSSSVNFPSLTDTDCVRSKGRVVLESFPASVATRLKQDMNAVSEEGFSRNKRRPCVLSGDFATVVFKYLDKLTDCKAYRIGRGIQRAVRACEQSERAVRISSMKEVVRLSVSLQRPYTSFSVLVGKREKLINRSNESKLYIFDAATTLNRQGSFSLVQALRLYLSIALYTFAEELFDDVSSAVFSLPLYSMAVMTD